MEHIFLINETQPSARFSKQTGVFANTNDSFPSKIPTTTIITLFVNLPVQTTRQMLMTATIDVVLKESQFPFINPTEWKFLTSFPLTTWNIES